MREGLRPAVETGLDRLVVESDSQVLIRYLNDDILLLSCLGSIVSDIIYYSLQFREISFNFIPRALNHVAHRLAQFGLSSLISCKWVNFTSDIISDVLLEDIS